MEIMEQEKKVIQLINEYLMHFHLEGWTAKIIKRNHTLGLCNRTKKIIAISKIILHDEEQLHETIRHEIAHALDTSRRGGHGKFWKYICTCVRCLPKARSTKMFGVKTPYKYIAICPICKSEYKRKTNRKRISYCRPCYYGGIKQPLIFKKIGDNNEN